MASSILAIQQGKWSPRPLVVARQVVDRIAAKHQNAIPHPDQVEPAVVVGKSRIVGKRPASSAIGRIATENPASVGPAEHMQPLLVLPQTGLDHPLAPKTVFLVGLVDLLDVVAGMAHGDELAPLPALAVVPGNIDEGIPLNLALLAGRGDNRLAVREQDRLVLDRTAATRGVARNQFTPFAPGFPLVRGHPHERLPLGDGGTHLEEKHDVPIRKPEKDRIPLRDADDVVNLAGIGPLSFPAPCRRPDGHIGIFLPTAAKPGD